MVIGRRIIARSLSIAFVRQRIARRPKSSDVVPNRSMCARAAMPISWAGTMYPVDILYWTSQGCFAPAPEAFIRCSERPFSAR